MAWIILIAAGLVEIVMALALKYAQGWTRMWPSLAGLVSALLSRGMRP
jgi:quaternary ammonium compound-resistance protein SugE